MKTLTVKYTVYTNQDKPVKHCAYRASFSGELAPSILRVGLNMINSDTKPICYYSITDISIDDVLEPHSDTFKDDRQDPFNDQIEGHKDGGMKFA